MKLLTLLLSLPFLVAAKPAPDKVNIFPHLTSGNELYQDYQSFKGITEKMPFDSGYYLGYVTGAVDMGNNILFCLPSGVTVGQLADLVGRYLADHPERRHASGAWLITEALSEHYPCKKPE